MKVRVRGGTRRHLEGRLFDLLDVMDGKEEAAWLEGDSPSTPSSTCSSWPPSPPSPPSSPSFCDFSPSSSAGPADSLTAVISAPFPASSMLLSRLKRECPTKLIEVLLFHKTAVAKTADDLANQSRFRHLSVCLFVCLFEKWIEEDDVVNSDHC